MPHNHSKNAKYHPKYWPVWFGFGLLRLVGLLPWGVMMAIGRFLGRLTQRLLPKRVRIAEVNLQLCFPELSAQQRADLLRRHYESLGMGVMDMCFAWWGSDRQVQAITEIQGAEHIAPAFKSGKGVVFLTAHFTSIEVSGRLLAGQAPVLPMYRRNENPAIEHLVVKNREHHVERTIPRDDARLMLRTLKANKGVWFAPDQNFGQKNSVFSTLFGIPAATNTSTSRFAEMTGATVVPFVVFRREDRPGYDLYIQPALENFPSGDVQQDTDRINVIIEDWMRRAPAQYLWSHRRFKDLPDGGKRDYS